jgi:hypothetical protein
MSYPRDCSGCAVGAHHRHNPDEGVMPGLIGGFYCNCTGDCADRFAAALERTRGLFVSGDTTGEQQQ